MSASIVGYERFLFEFAARQGIRRSVRAQAEGQCEFSASSSGHKETAKNKNGDFHMRPPAEPAAHKSMFPTDKRRT